MKRVNLTLTIVLLLLISLIIYLGYRWSRSDRVTAQGFVEMRTLRASSKIAGRISKLFVAEGEMVQKGDTLYTIATPELDAKLAQVEAILSEAKAIEAKAKAGTRKELVRASHDMWRKAQAGLTLATQTYERVQRLYSEGVVTAQKRDEAYASLEAMRANEMAAKAQYLLAVEGASREDKEAAEAQVREAQSVVEEVERYLADRVVYSPVDGEVMTVTAYAGELVGTGYPVVTIAENGTAKAIFNIAENLLPQIRMGEKFEGRVPALDRSVELQVEYISAEADFATQSATSARGDFDIRTFEVKMQPSGNIPLRAGMSVIIELQKPKKQ